MYFPLQAGNYNDIVGMKEDYCIRMNNSQLHGNYSHLKTCWVFYKYDI
jgi:hypothetical protein